MSWVFRVRLCAWLVALGAWSGATPAAQTGGQVTDIDARAEALEAKLVAWRRDFHQHPELGNREERTAGIIAAHLRSLGLEVRTQVAKTGVVGVLRGGLPGPTIALRTELDALPVDEQVDVPFKSTVRTAYAGQQVGVMHACGHDLHMAIFMGAAEMLAAMRDRLAGTIIFLAQPAEEGPPPGEEGGAPLVIKEGVLQRESVKAIFGLHVFPFPVGSINVRPNGLMAAADIVRIRVQGRQTHGALPWAGVDPVVVAAQIVLGLQAVVSRQSDLTKAPAVVSIGLIQGGNRWNILPDVVLLEGTVRTFDPAMQDAIHQRITQTAEHIATASGATAAVEFERRTPVTWNDAALTARMAPTLQRVAGARFNGNVQVTTTGEDFAFYQKNIPGLFFFLGITPEGVDPASTAPNHSPLFAPDERALVTGLRAMVSLAVDYLSQEQGRR